LIARWFRVRVSDAQTRNGVGWFRPPDAPWAPGVEHVGDPSPRGRRGMIFDIASEDGERVEVFID
jgi:hypothetical protein